MSQVNKELLKNTGVAMATSCYYGNSKPKPSIKRGNAIVITLFHDQYKRTTLTLELSGSDRRAGII